MSKTIKHQQIYDVLNGKNIPYEKKKKVYQWFTRINFWDVESKIKYRIRKDWRRGGLSRIKKKNYK